MTGFAPFDRLFEPLSWSVVGWLVLAVLLYKGSRIVPSGFGGIYRCCGIALFEVRAGLWPGLWPLLDVTNELFCGYQVEAPSEKDEPQEVVTSDGVTCRRKIRLLWRVKSLRLMVTLPYDADEQLRCKAETELGGCGGWVSQHSYQDCCKIRSTLEMIPETVKLADSWGIELLEVQNISFAPANPEAQALASCLAMEQQRSLAAQERAGVTKKIVTDFPQLNPSLVFAALSGMPISVVAPTDQLAALRAAVQAVNDKLPQPDDKEQEGLVATGIEAAIGQIPVFGPMVQPLLGTLTSSLNKEE